MKSSKLGKNILEVEVLNISQFGIWLFVKGKEYFLKYSDHSWFKNATVDQILDFELIHGTHLYWKNLDVDLAIESLDFPKKFPLKFKK
jgi:hypothetical protein